MDVPVPFPPSLAPYRADVQTYTTAKIRQFSGAFVRNLGLNIAPEQLDSVVTQTINGLAAQDIIPSRALRLVLRHDCQSTGCGETGCLLCQYNPSRLCKRNIKAKYLIDDHLKAKCGAPLRVELVDETNACVLEGLPAGMQLECHVMNGEKYKEICPENTLLSHAQLRSCIISHHTRALLRRDGGSDDQLRCFLQLERGQAVLSDLQVTTSSEALLAGKAPTFRLLIWAVDAAGEPVPSVTYVVSEYFVVATKRVKHAIKSDIPSVSDHVSKLVHIGKATVDKLTDLRQAAHEEGFEIAVPDDLNSVANVGQFQRLVELSEINTDLKNKVRHLLKLSPEKWEEVCNHAQSAVMPDFRPRAWWCPALKAGLLFACKNGAVVMDQPIALVKMGATQLEEDQVIPIAQLDVQLFNTIPKLKAQAVQSWYAQSHPGWAIYCKQEPLGADSGKEGSMLGAGAGALPPAPPAPSSSAGGAVAGYSNANGGGATSRSAFQLPGRIPTPPAAPSPPSLNLPPIPPAGPLPGAPGATAPSLWPLPGMQLPLPGGPKLEDSGAPQPPRVSNGSQGGAPPPPSLSSSGAAGAGKPGTPFAVPGVMGGLTNHFPQFPAPGSQPGAGQQPAPQGLENKGISQAQDSLNLLLSQLGGQSGLVTLPGQEAGPGSAPPGGEITIERGLSQFNSLLVGNESLAAFGTLGPSGGTLGPGGPTGGAGVGGPAGGAGTALPITALAPDNSLNGTLNAFMQDSGDQLGDPAAKRQRLTAPEEVQAAK